MWPKTHFLLISNYVLNLLNLHFNRLSASGFDWRCMRVGKVEVWRSLTVTGAVWWGMRSSLEHNEKHYVAVNEEDCVLMVINQLYSSNQIKCRHLTEKSYIQFYVYFMPKLSEILMQHILMLNHYVRICLYQKAKAVQICFVWTIVRFFISIWSLSHSFDYRGILRPTETGKRLVFDPRMSCSCAILSALVCCKHPFLVLDSLSRIHTFCFFQISGYFHIS